MTNKTDQEREAFDGWKMGRAPLLEEIAKRDELIKMAREALEYSRDAVSGKKTYTRTQYELCNNALTRINAFQTEEK